MTLDRFERAVARVLDWEGEAYVDDALDAGGCTRFGITIPALRASRGRPVTCDDIRRLTRNDAIAVYRAGWWLRHGYDRLPEPIGEHVFDFAVNAGPAASHRALQRALRAVGQPVGEDGLLGPATIGAACQARPGELLAAFRMAREAYYRIICALHPEQNRFLAGWLNRAHA